MKHLNNSLLCAMDIETTGLDPDYHEIVDIAIVPLNSVIEPYQGILPFTAQMNPEFPKRVDIEAARKIPILQDLYKDKLLTSQTKFKNYIVNGIPQRVARELLVEFFEEKLRLPPGKRIIPVGCNYVFDRSFLQKFLGVKTYDYIFSDNYRDVQLIASWMNDLAFHRGLPYPFQKINLQYLCSTLKIERNGTAHTALDDSYVTAKVYKQMLFRSV